MTQNPPEAPATHPSDSDGPAGPDTGPRVTRDEVRDLSRLRRSRDDRKIAGVAGGLARHLDIDPIILRVALVVLIFFGGAGILLYGAAWLLVPEEDTNAVKLRLDDRSRTVALVLVGGLAALAVIGDSMGSWGFPWPLAILGVIVLVVVAARSDYKEAPSPAAAGAAQPGATAAPPPPATYQPRPRNPRKRGPVLFWFTLALTALALGVLGIVDAAGGPVTDSAYPVLALGIIGAMLVVGAFYGRAGGLIALGLVAALAGAGATAAREIDAGRIDETPRLASQVEETYDLFAGQIDLDLTEVQDYRALDGRTIDLELVMGKIVVKVPPDMTVEVDADVDAGQTRLFGDDEDHSNRERYVAPATGAPVITIDAEVMFGEIVVELEGSNR